MPNARARQRHSAVRADDRGHVCSILSGTNVRMSFVAKLTTGTMASSFWVSTSSNGGNPNDHSISSSHCSDLDFGLRNVAARAWLEWRREPRPIGTHSRLFDRFRNRRRLSRRGKGKRWDGLAGVRRVQTGPADLPGTGTPTPVRFAYHARQRRPDSTETLRRQFVAPGHRRDRRRIRRVAAYGVGRWRRLADCRLGTGRQWRLGDLLPQVHAGERAINHHES